MHRLGNVQGGGRPVLGETASVQARRPRLPETTLHHRQARRQRLGVRQGRYKLVEAYPHARSRLGIAASSGFGTRHRSASLGCSIVRRRNSAISHSSSCNDAGSSRLTVPTW